MKNDETIEKLNPIKDLEFVITNDMKETIFEMLTIQQLLNKEELSILNLIFFSNDFDKCLKVFHIDLKHQDNMENDI